MCISRNNRGFTLLEVMIATLIVAMLTFSLYRFINSTLTALRISTEVHDDRESVQALVRFLQTQMNDLQPQRQGVITGAPYLIQGVQGDELTWICPGGLGVMTDAAPGDYRVTFTLDKSATKKPGEQGIVYELGLRREPIGSENDQTLNADFFTRGTGPRKYNWWPVLRGVVGLRIQYYDATQKVLLKEWPQTNRRPSLVQISIYRTQEDKEEETPYVAVLEVPSARLEAQQ